MAPWAKGGPQGDAVRKEASRASIDSGTQKQGGVITVAQYDYIVIGAGSAGAPMAARLAENPDTQVLLLEAGGPDTDYRFVKQLGGEQLSGGAIAARHRCYDRPRVVSVVCGPE